MILPSDVLLPDFVYQFLVLFVPIVAYGCKKGALHTITQLVARTL